MRVHIAEQVDTVIWDFDGTLLKTFDIFRGVLKTVLEGRGMEVPSEQVFASHFHGPLDQSIRGVVGERVSARDFQRILREFIAIDNEYIQVVDDHLYADAVDLAQRINATGSRTQLVVTDRKHGIDRRNGSPRTLIENSCLSSIIEAVICHDDHGYSKPDKRSVMSYRKHVGEVLVVGDQVVDAELARQLGGTAILVRRNNLPLAYADRLAQLSSRTHIMPTLDQVEVQHRRLPIPAPRTTIMAPELSS